MELTSTLSGQRAAERRGHSVDIDKVFRIFGDVIAVHNVTLSIPAGEFVSILGPSGCGKTTLLRIIAGLDFPDSGRILIDGRDVTAVPAHRRPTNLVFQRGALFPHMSVFDNIAYPLRRLRRSRKTVTDEVTEMLALVRLGQLSKRMPSELSGGQAQRVALARALVSRPAVLLLDEPLSALDLSLRKEMQLELRRLQEVLGMTFIYVTHDQEEALTMSSRIVVMHDGNVVQVGTPREIYESPENVFASTFIGETNLLRGQVVRCSDGIATIQVEGHEVRALETRELTLGSDVAVSVRPERIRIKPADDASESWNSLPGTVVEMVYLGSRIRARLDCDGTSLWVQQEATTPESEQFVEAAQSTIWWAVADGRVLTLDEP